VQARIATFRASGPAGVRGVPLKPVSCRVPERMVHEQATHHLRSEQAQSDIVGLIWARIGHAPPLGANLIVSLP